MPKRSRGDDSDNEMENERYGRQQQQQPASRKRGADDGDDGEAKRTRRGGGFLGYVSTAANSLLDKLANYHYVNRVVKDHMQQYSGTRQIKAARNFTFQRGGSGNRRNDVVVEDWHSDDEREALNKLD